MLAPSVISDGKGTSKTANSYHMKVAVRIRPALPRQNETPSSLETTSILTPHVLLPPSTSQSAMYSTLTDGLLTKIRDGYNTSIIAYGQTGSGKTHTIFGPAGKLRRGGDYGLMPRLMQELIESDGMNTISASAVEIYQDLAYDLLNDSAPLTVGSKGRNQIAGVSSSVAVAGPNTRLGAVGGSHPAGCYCCVCERAKMRKQEEFKQMMAKRRGEAYFGKGTDPFAQKNASSSLSPVNYATVGEKIVPLNNLTDILDFCRTVELSRASASHELNERSSRSHCLVTIHVNVIESNKSMLRTKVLLVDLAGSERIAKSKVEGVAKAQAIEINKSLTALGRVVKSLAMKQTHVPYRDSTLTMLLRDSFGGKASTTVIVCVGDVEKHNEETVRSLQFGQRLGGVRNKAKANVAISDNKLIGSRKELEALLKLKKDEIKQLDGGGINADATNPATIRKFNNDMKKLEAMKASIKQMKEDEYNGSGVGSNAKLTELREQARVLEENIERSKGAVDRLTMRAFWRQPSKAYINKAAEIAEVEGRLTRFT